MSTELINEVLLGRTNTPDNEKVLSLEYGPNFKVVPTNDQIKELQTVIRDK